MNRVSGRIHQRGDIGFALHHRAHVMVIDEPHAFIERPLADFRHPRAEGLPLIRPQHRPLRQRPFRIAVDGVRRFRKHQHIRSHRLEQIEMLAQVPHLLRCLALQKLRGIPAGNASQVIGCKRRL